MNGISSSGKEQIAQKVENLFDRIAVELIGEIPRIKNKAKTIIFTSTSNLGLPNLFLQGMDNREPNAIEKDALKGLLNSAYDYIESLKSKTRANVTERIDGLVREARMANRSPSAEEVQAILDDELSKAKSLMQAIVEAESTKMRNMGVMMSITRIASSLDDDDPNVYFIVVKDGKACKECVRLHLMPDESTPRVWKFSELKQGYHKRSENVPSAFGLHPHCRCTLTYLSKGFGFKEGRIAYKKEDHDEHSSQKSKKD